MDDYTELLCAWTDGDGDKVEVFRFTEPDIPEGSPIGELATTSLNQEGEPGPVVVVHVDKQAALAARDGFNQMLAEASH